MSDRRAIFSWCLYDWANSGFPTVVSTFLFATYFVQGVVGDPVEGQTLWAYAQAAAGLLIAVVSPVIGARADRSGRKKPSLAVLTALLAAATAALWWVAPERDSIVLAIILAIVAGTLFEAAAAIYNALLVDVAPPDRYGRISGFGWGLGYFGGLLCLAVALFGLVQADPAPFGLDKASAEHIRAAFPLTALWLLAFAWPLFLFVREQPRAAAAGPAPGLAEIWGQIAHTVAELRGHPVVARFLASQMLVMTGLATLFAFGAVYAAGRFGLSTEEVLMFGLGLNVTAGLGAFGFALIEDRIGSLKVMIWSLAGLLAIGTAMLLVDDVGVFIVLGLGVGVFFGPTQSASRALMARVAPPDLAAGLFGVYALAGRSINFAGPLAVALATTATGSQAGGMVPVLLLLAGGLALLPRRLETAAR